MKTTNIFYRALCLLVMALCSVMGVGQTLWYTHDASGNRTQRSSSATAAMSASPPVSRSVAAPASVAATDMAALTYAGRKTSYTLDTTLPVGSLPYTFRVNPNGSAAFDIPLEVPEGQAGLTPDIRIHYNSLAGEGVLGQGMNLSCLSSITRCGKRDFYDGVNEAVSTTGDAFELDGLRLIKTSSTIHYMKEVDDFSRITYSTSYFLVQQKDGTKLYYGDYNGSNGCQLGSDGTTRIAWYLAMQQDAHGNYIRYQYDRDVATGDIWLTGITYTLHGSRTFAHTHEVSFGYQEYAQAHGGYIGGMPVKRNKILKEMVAKTNGNVMRRYAFEYIQPTDNYGNRYPRLQTIRPYGTGGTTALNPMQLEWGNEGQALFSSTVGQTSKSSYVQGDFNGDGRDDLLTVYDLSTTAEHTYPREYLAVYRYGNPNGFSNELTVHTFTNQYQEVKAYAGDFNGDGLDDVFFHTSSGFEYWKASTTTNNLPTFTKQSYTLNPSGAASANIIVMADVDGDNMDELVVENRYYNHASTTATTYTLPSFGVFYKYMVGDVDADGCQDIIVCDEYGQVKVTNPAKNRVILTHNFGYSYMLGPNSVLLSGYFNNDRYLDFLMIGGYNATTVNNSSKAVVYYHTGEAGEYVTGNVSVYNDRFTSHALGDLNGDGLTDLIYINSQSIDECKEQGLANDSWSAHRISYLMAPFGQGVSGSHWEEDLYLSPEVSGTVGVDDVYFHSDNKYYVYPSKHYFLVGDYSGDGKSDIANICEFDHGYFNNYPYLTSCTSLKVICPAHQSTSNLVTGITNGDGTVRSISYGWQSTAMRNPKFYNGMYAGWNKDIPTFSTVTDVELGSLYGDALMENTSYTYSGTAYISRDVRKFQGFKEIVRLDSVSQKSVTEGYQVQAPFSAYPYYFCNVRTTKANGQYVSQETYSLGGFYVYQHRWGTFFISSESHSDNLEGTRESISYTRDSSANITKIRTVRSQLSGMDPLTTIEDMTYANYPGLSTFPNRMTSYRKTDIAAGDTIVHPMKSYSYNSGGDLMSETEHGMTKNNTYDATTGLRLSESVTADGQTRTTAYEYDDWRYVKKVTDPSNWVTTYTKDGFGNVLTETTPDGRTTTHQYDAFGKLVKTLSHEQVATDYLYQWAEGSTVAGGKAMVKLQQHYDGVKTAETLTDAYGRTLQESSLQPGSVWKHLRSTYGTNGLLTKQEELAGSTVMTKVEYTYDNYRRITQEKQTSANNTALNRTVNYTYSGLTETRTTVTDQQETVTLVHDAKGNLLSQADSKGTTTYTYDAAGRLTGVASPGYPMTATYNEYGLCTSVTNPSSGTTTYTYNGFDELATETDAKGNTITYTYNANGLPTGKNDGSRNIIYTYNTKGQLTYSGYGGGHMSTFTYTADGLLSKEVRSIEGVMLTKQYTYDSKGRLDTYTSPSGLVLKYGYDSAHHLTSITDNATGAKLWEAKTYNAQGLIATESGVGGRQTTYTYDQAGRPLTMSNNLASFTYTYNGGGQLTQRVENFGTSGLTETFAYDAGGCLTSSTLQGKTPVTVSYNSGRGITNKSDVGTYSYASNGAPLATVNPVSGYNPSAQSITYNSSNLPASITQGGYTRTYTYDVNDQRDYSVLTKSNSSLPFAASKRYYFGDFERNINTENNVVTDLDYIFANGRLVALIKTVGTTKTAYGVLTDRQGSLRALYNGSGLVQSFSYDAWGNRRNPSTGVALTTSELVAANSITNRGYTCHEHMDEFGLINMNARIYDPALGLFISVDPLAEEYYNTYPYAYCGGDPVNRVDWTGEDWYEDPYGNMFWREGHDEIEGYTNIGATATISWGEDIVFNYYQNMGILGDKTADAIDLVASTPYYMQQAFGRDSGLSIESQKVLFTKIQSRGKAELGREAGLYFVGELAGGLVGKFLCWTFGKAVGWIAGKFIGTADNVIAPAVKGYTKSNLKLGRQMHEAYHAGEYGKEFLLPNRKRIDFLDIKNGIIYELKPNNPRAIKQGEKQLRMYLEELQKPTTIQKHPELKGIQWRTILETY